MNRFFHSVSNLLGDPGFDLQAAITAGELGILLVMKGWDFASYADEDFLSGLDLGTWEFDGGGYSRKALTNATWNYRPVDPFSDLRADDVLWPSLQQASFPAIGAVLTWDNGLTGVDATTKPLVFFGDGGFPLDGTGRPFTLKFDPAGVFRFVAYTP